MKYMISMIFLIICTNIGHSPPKESVLYITMPKEEGVRKPSSVTDRVTDINILHPAFRNKVVMLLYEAAKQGIELEIVETYRTPERQNHLKRQGYSMLHGGKSKHQHHLAIDVVPVKYGWYMWHDKELWEKIGKIGEKQGLFWGGRWKRFRDYPHFEYPISVDSVQYIPMPDTVIIPLNY